jgi:hypothetical protein
MSSIYNIVAPQVGNPANAQTASHLKGDAETNKVSSNGNTNINFTNAISFSGVSSPQLLGTASMALNLPLLPGGQAYNFTSSWASNVRNAITSSYLNYTGIGSTGTASYAISSSYANTSSYAAVAGNTGNNTFAFGSYYLLSGNFYTAPGAGVPLTGAVSLNISSVKTLGVLKYATDTDGGDNKIAAFGVEFASPVSSTNYTVIGTAWQYNNFTNSQARGGSVFIPHDVAIAKKTTTSFTMSLHVGDLVYDSLNPSVAYINFQVLGY